MAFGFDKVCSWSICVCRITGERYIERLKVRDVPKSVEGEIYEFECLARSPPVLTGVESQVFTIERHWHINLQSPSLLDVLAETKSTDITSKKTVKPVTQIVPQIAVPTALEWEA
jgi:hypothetical protein